MDVNDCRRKHLMDFKRAEGSWQKLAERVESVGAHLGRIGNGHRNMGDELARRFERTYQKPFGWMDRLDDRPIQGSIEMEILLQNYVALPDGLRAYIERKTAALRQYADTLPGFLRDALAAPRDAAKLREWEREIEADMVKKLSRPNEDQGPSATSN